MIKSRNILKGFFQTGKKPLPSNYLDLIDSLAHLEEDKAQITTPPDLDDEKKFVTPRFIRSAIDAFTVQKVNNVLPDKSGNVSIENIAGTASTITGSINLSQVKQLQENLDNKVDSTNVKTINNTSILGKGNIDITGGQTKIYAVPSAPYTIPGTTSPNAFPPGCDTVTLEANKTYIFKGKYLLANGTSHTISIGWTSVGLGITSMEYVVRLFSSNLNAYATALSQTQVSGIALKVLNSSTASPTTTIEFEGVLRCTTRGTLTPIIAFSTPAITPLSTMKLGSFLEFTEIGSNVMEK